MSWQETFTRSPWTGALEYIEARKVELTSVCVNPKSTDMEIRAAQAAIIELQSVADLATRIKHDAQVRSLPRRQGY